MSTPQTTGNQQTQLRHQKAAGTEKRNPVDQLLITRPQPSAFSFPLSAFRPPSSSGPPNPEKRDSVSQNQKHAARLQVFARRVAVAALVTLTLHACSAPLAIADSGPRPNIIVILVDDLGYGDLSSYGAKDLETPNVDRLVRQGMKFTNFYANCPVCSPTRAALLSGRYQESVGVPGVIRTHWNNSWGLLDPNAVLLPAALKKAGYRTAMFGKWHLGLGEPNLPNLRGFDHFHGFLGDMMDDYFHHRRHDVNYMRINRKTIDPPGHATDLFTEWTCRWLQEHDKKQPFFLYLPYNAPHNPIQPPEAFLKKYKAKHPHADATRAKLAAFIEHLDSGVGRVLATLDETGLADNTLVIFTSDNGGELRAGAHNGPLRDGKGKTYEGGIRVPMVARWPGKIAPGTRSEAIALTMDLYPTALEAAGLPPQADLDGVSILPILLGKKPDLPPRDLFFSRLMPPGRIHAVRHGRYKLLRPWPDKPLELYDLEADPRETTDLSKTNPDLFTELKSALDAHIARFADVPYRDSNGKGPGEIDRPKKK